MSQPSAAPGGPRACARRHLKRTPHRAGVAALALALAVGCGARRAALPLESPDEASVPAPTPGGVEEDAVVPLEEEPLFEDDTALAATDPTLDADALPVVPPPLLDTIDGTTAPHVAAATRLVDNGRARMIAGDYGGALEQLERAIAIDSGNPYAYYYLARLHLIHRTYDQAIAFADRAASLSDTQTPAWASRAYSLQGNAFEAVGRFADARSAYLRAIQAAPGNLAAQVGLARIGSPPPAQP